MQDKVYHDCIEKVDTKTTLALFDVFQKQDWAFLLDSCEQSDNGGRYDIIVQSPCFYFEFKNGTAKLGGPWVDAGKVSPLPFTMSKPYLYAQKLHANFCLNYSKKNVEELGLPFVIGAVGAFAYDLNIYTDDIIDAKTKQFLLPEISLGFYDKSIIYDNVLQTLHVFSADKTYIHQIKILLTKLQQPLDDFSLVSGWRAKINKDDYLKKITKIKEYLSAGDCYQVNFAQAFSSSYSGCEWTAYQLLRQHNKAPFSCFARLKHSTIMSLSPERFLKLNNKMVETKPIKGTRKRDLDPNTDKQLAKDLLAAEKDRAENLMIVDLLRNDLSKNCEAHSVKVPKLFSLESFPAVHHMVSTVEAKLKADSTPFALFGDAFPGGSITGAPKVRAMQIIQELETDKRSIYCGSIAYFGLLDDMDSSICIRTLLAESSTLYCWAGGGIVYDSISEDEYLESLQKVSKILPVLE